MQLALVGDIALGDHPKTVGFGFRSRYPEGIPERCTSRLLPPGTEPDLVFGNLEFSLGLDPGRAASLAERQCRGIDQYAAFLASAGVSALNLANNHCAQHGHRAFDATATELRASGISVSGIPRDFTQDAILPVGEHRISILGWSHRPRQYSPESPPYNEFSEDAYERIREAKRHADIVIASMHWGEEFVQIPANPERRIARAMIDAGASIVVGHHPHVLREIEEYAGGLIAYSLGNFVGDMTWDPNTRLGGCLLVDMQGRAIRSHRLVLTRIAADYLPVYLTETEAARARARMTRVRRRQAEQIDRRGYEAVVDAELRRHVRKTGLMMLRNLHRYPRDVRAPMLLGPVTNRVPRWLRPQNRESAG